MILDKSFTIDWLEEKRRELKCDIILLERATRALQLLELIALSGAEFTFKGGTSMMLLTEEFSRLSIDLDIVVNPGANIIPIFEAITQVDRHKFTHMRKTSDKEREHNPFDTTSSTSTLLILLRETLTCFLMFFTNNLCMQNTSRRA